MIVAGQYFARADVICHSIVANLSVVKVESVHASADVNFAKQT